VLASFALMATVLSTDAVPALERVSDVYSDRVIALVVALAQADADFARKQEELGLTGSAPLVGLGDKAEPVSPNPAPPDPASPASSRGTGHRDWAAKPAPPKGR